MPSFNLRSKLKAFKKALPGRKRKESRNLQDVFCAITEGYVMLARILINDRFDVNEVGCSGETLLITLCRTSTTESEEKILFVRYLLNAGAVINFNDKFGRTALYYAERNNLHQITKELLTV